MKMETLKVIQAKNKELDAYAKTQVKLETLDVDTPRHKLKRPKLKGKKDTDAIIASLSEKPQDSAVPQEMHKVTGHPQAQKKTNMKN